MKESNLNIGRSEAERMLEALRSGAKLSGATVFISSGGSSLGVVCLWPGSLLSTMSLPRARAELAVSVEEALPGWLWSAASVPGKGEAWPQASFGLSPGGAEKGDSTAVGRAVKDGRFALALGLLDAAVGSASHRVAYDGPFRFSSLLRALQREQWGNEGDESWKWAQTPVKYGLGGVLGFSGLVGGLESSQCAVELEGETPSAAEPSAPGRRLGL